MPSSMFDSKHFSEISHYHHHMEPTTLMPYQFENPDWMARESLDTTTNATNNNANTNATSSWDTFDYQFEFYPHEQTAPDAAEMSPSSDGESDAAWSRSTSQSSSLMPTPITPIKEESVNEYCLHTPSATSVERSISPEQTTGTNTTTTTSTAVPKKRDSAASNTSRKSASVSTDPADLNVMKRKKAAHNAIEKRYRTNMNAKFVALGDAIPSFRHRQGLHGSGKNASKKSLSLKEGNVATAGTQQLSQNKSEVLTNALAYIRELQEQNRLLQSEVTLLKGNLLAPAAAMWRPVGMP